MIYAILFNHTEEQLLFPKASFHITFSLHSEIGVETKKGLFRGHFLVSFRKCPKRSIESRFRCSVTSIRYFNN